MATDKDSTDGNQNREDDASPDKDEEKGVNEKSGDTKEGGNQEKEDREDEKVREESEKGESEDDGDGKKTDGADSAKRSEDSRKRSSSRERKPVDRFVGGDPFRTSPSPGKNVKIEKGPGIELNDIPKVASNLSKRKAADDTIQLLHSILFGKTSKVNMLKKNIGHFSGFVWVKNEKAKLKEKLDKCLKEKLLDICDLFNIQVSDITKKKEIISKLLDFLESPYDTTKGRKRKASTGTNSISASPSPGKSKKKQKRDSDSGKKPKHSTEEDNKNESVGDTTSSESKGDQKEPKAVARKSSKRSGKKDTVKTELSSSEEDKKVPPQGGSSRKNKGKQKTTGAALRQPSGKEIYAELTKMLKGKDMSKRSFSGIKRQLEKHFGVDLTHRKAEVKEIVGVVLANVFLEDGDSSESDGDDE